jgi:O-antigen/teichoic acid export membrane protein
MSAEAPGQGAVVAGAATGDHSAKLSRVARGSTLNLVGAVVSAVANFALTVVITRGVAKDVAGLLFTTTSLVLMAAAIGRLGTDTGLVYFIARARAAGKEHLIRAYLRAARRPVFVSAMLMGVIALATAPVLGRVFSSEHAGLATGYLVVLAFVIPLAGVENVALSATRGLGTMRPNALVEQIIRPLLQVVMVAVVVWLGDPHLLAVGWGLCYVAAAFLAWRALSARLRSLPADTDSAPSVRAEFWRFSAPRSLASMVQQAMQRFDIVLVALISGPASAAIYTAATRFLVVGQMARNAISLAAQPDIAQAMHREDRAEIKALYQTSTAWLMLVTWPIYLLLMIDGRPLLKLFGHGYDSGSTVLVLLSLAMLVATLCGDVDVMLIMAARTTWSLANISVAFGVNLVLDLILIPHLGILGAAIGWSVAIVTKNVMALVQVAAVFHLHPIGRATVTCAAVCLGTCLVLPSVIRLLAGSGTLTTLVGALVSGLGFLACLYLFRRGLGLEALKIRPGAKRGLGTLATTEQG